jgi:hypothetical protein
VTILGIGLIFLSVPLLFTKEKRIGLFSALAGVGALLIILDVVR